MSCYLLAVFCKKYFFHFKKKLVTLHHLLRGNLCPVIEELNKRKDVDKTFARRLLNFANSIISRGYAM